MPHRPTPLFDPLKYLRDEVRAVVTLDPDGVVRTRLPREFDSPQRRRQVQRILDHYAQLIALQIEHNGASIQKLLAHGKIKLVKGRYVRLKK